MINNKSKELMNSINEFKKVMEKCKPNLDISHGEFLMLKTIKEIENQNVLANMSLISSNLNISNAAVSQVINALEARHLVKRIISTDDRRNIIVEVTEEGTLILRSAKETMFHFMNHITESLGEKDTDKLIELINKLKDAANKRKEDQ